MKDFSTKFNFTKSVQRVIALLCFFVLSAFYPANAQSVTIEKANASGCYYYIGASKTTISVQVGWVGASNGNIITVTIDGDAATERTIKPQSYYDPGGGSIVAGPIVTPQVVAFEINSDGASHNIQAVLKNGSTILATSTTVNVLAPTPCAPTACTGTDLGGMVYFDNNANGVHESGETKGISAVIVKAFDKNGAVYTAISDVDGKYAFSVANSNAIAAANFPVRLEFTNFTTETQGYAGPSLSGNASSVRFVSSPGCGIDCGASSQSKYAQSNPTVFSSLFINGNPLIVANSNDAGKMPAIIAHDYSNMTEFNFTTIATNAQVGTVWAHAWNKYKKKLFSAAFLKRHSGLGPLGLGGIYAVDYTNPALPVVSNFLDVTSLGINIGSIADNATRGLLASKLQPNRDEEALAKVGKVGIGGMDFSEDGNTLFFVNLFDKKVYSIDIANYLTTGVAPTASDVDVYTIPDPGCVNGEFHPFALKIYEGKLYVGLVCDASTGTKSNLTGFIKSMNITTGTWSDVFDLPLTYPKGYPDQGDRSKTGWYPWSDDISVIGNSSGTGAILHPVPMLSDIEFDLDGTMVLAFMDRTCHQMGVNNYDNVNPTSLAGAAFAGGDVLRAFYSNGTYVLENNAKAGPNVGYAPNNNQGPGFGEFYNDNIGGGVSYHSEMVTGGLALLPGSGEVMIGMVDPSYFRGTGTLWANGIRVNSNTTGDAVNGKSYYSNSGIAQFGKANGMGDITLALDALSFLEIGNYVWNDANDNGVQDPIESGLPGVKMSLYNSATGALVKTTTTDANGNYYFSTLNGDNILPNTNYCVLAGATQFSTGTGLFTVGSDVLKVSPTTTGQGVNAILNDNNFSTSVLSSALGAMPAGLPKYCLTTGAVGFVNHSIDLGLSCTKPSAGADMIACGGSCIDLNGTNPTSGTWSAQAGNPAGATLGTTTAGVAQVCFSVTASGNFNFIYTTPLGCADTMTVVATPRGSIGNYVWNDLNGNYLNDEPASAGINGLTVELYKDNGTGTFVLVNTTTTANNGGNPGYYNFYICESGDYKVKFPLTNASGNGLTVQTPTAGTDGNSDATASTGYSPVFTITLTGTGLQVNNPTIDAGYLVCTKPSAGSDMTACGTTCITIKGTSTTPGGLATDGTWTAASTNAIGATLGTTILGEAQVCFTNTASGTYRFVYSVSGGCTDTMDVVVSPQPNAGADKVTCYNNGNGTVNLAASCTGTWYAPSSNPGSSIITNAHFPTTTVTNFSAAGTYAYLFIKGACADTMNVVVTPSGTIGNYVWADTNADGIFNESTTNGINGVTVDLYKDNGTGTFVVSQTAVTANDKYGNPGYYNFVICSDGNYKVKFPTSVNGAGLTVQTPIAGTDNNSDADVTTGFSPVFTIDTHGTGVAKDNPTIDAGYKIPATTSCNMSASIGVNQIAQCVINNNYQFTSNVTGGTAPYTYLWDFNDGTYSSLQNPTHTYATAGEHDVTLIVKDSRGCEAHASTVQLYVGAKPVASFDIYDHSGSGAGISFSSTSTITGGWLTYNWNLGNGTTSTLVNPGPVYYATGTYTVTLIATGNFGCSDTITKTIHVTNGSYCIAPTAAFSINNATQCLTGNSFIFTNSSLGIPTSYVWNFGDGSANVTTANASHVYASANTYTVTLTATNACGTSTTTKTVIVNTVPATPSAITGPTSVSIGAVIALSHACNCGVWSSTSTAVATIDSNGVVLGIAAGTTTIKYTVTNACGTASVSYVVTVTSTSSICVAPVADFTINTATQCLTGNAFTFTNTSTGAAPSYTWSFGDATASVNTTNGTHSYASANTYTVTLTASNLCGTNTITKSVIVNTTPVQPAAISGTTSIETGTTTTLSSATAGGVWSSSNTAVATIDANTGLLTGITAGSTTITYSVSNSCGSATRTAAITITTPVVTCVAPVASFTINNAAQCLVGNAFTFTNTSTGTAPTYSWTYGDASGTVFATNGSHSYAAVGNYTVTLTATNACGTNSSSQSVALTTTAAQPAAIGGTTALAIGSSTTLSSATAGGVWSSANTSVATINPTTGLVTGIAAGTATITYTVINACGSASVTTLVTVNTACITPVANFTINNATQCLSGNSFVFTNTTTGTASSYTWNFGNGSATATSPTNTYTTAGTYTVTLQASSACGGSSKTTTVTVLGTGVAPAAIGGTPTVPAAANTSLSSATLGGVWSSSNTAVATVNSATGLVTGVSVGTATITYTVNAGCGTTSTSIVVTVTAPCGAATSSSTNASICSGNTYIFNGVVYSAAGTYTAHLTNSVGCDSAAVLVLTVNPLPAAPAAITGSASVLVSATATYTSATAGGVWSSSNTGVATISSTGVLTAVSAGTTTISYTVTNACGSTSATKQVTVAPNAACNLSASFSINNVRQCVTDNSFVFTNTTTGGTAPFTYLWDLNDGTTASTRDVTKSYATYGEHDVTLRVSDVNGCVSHAAAQQLYVGAKPVANFTVISNTGSGLSKTFISSSTIATGTMSYLWDFGTPSVPNSTLANPTVTFAAGAYNVKLTVTGLGTCKDEMTQTITETGICVVSVYPNPVVNIVDVSFRSASATLTTIRILDLQGRVLQIQTVMPAYVGANVVASINTSGLQSGTYVIDVSDQQNGHLTSKTILKQ